MDMREPHSQAMPSFLSLTVRVGRAWEQGYHLGSQERLQICQQMKPHNTYSQVAFQSECWKVAHKHLVTTWWRWSSHLNVVDKRVHLLRKMSPHHFNLQVINGRQCSRKHGSVTSTHHFLEGWDDVWQLAKDTDVLRNKEKIQSPATNIHAAWCGLCRKYQAIHTCSWEKYITGRKEQRFVHTHMKLDSLCWLSK